MKSHLDVHTGKTTPNRAGRINPLWAMLLGVGGLIGFLIVVLKIGTTPRDGGSEILILYAAAGMRVPVEEIVNDYKAETGVTVEIQFNGSNTLLNQLQTDKFTEVDLYLAADDFYTEMAVELGLASATIPIAHQRPVIAVRKDSKKKIETLADLLREDVVVAVANPDQAAVGKTARRQLLKVTVGDTNRWAQLEAHVTKSGVFKPTVNDIANDVKIGSVDAAIVWDSTVAMPKFSEDLVAVPVPELDTDPNLVSIAILRSSPSSASASRFARYLAARDKGLKTFGKYLRPVEGDVWEDPLQVNFFCGAVNRHVVEKIVAEFEQDEGVTINTMYDGCGILTSRMQTIDKQQPSLGFPDVYMACDVYYLENVKQWFQEAANVSDVELVIAVPKNSTMVKSLEDFVKRGVRVAVGEPTQCTIGALTRRLLKSENLYDKLKEKQAGDGEVVVEKSSSATLIADVAAGHVDATIAYISDVLPNTDDVDIIRIDSPLNIAIQPFSIAKTSEHKHLLRRLYKRIANSPEAFEAAGFHFRLTDKSVSESAGE
ncbi:MAG TPA: molybdate ABC transporter substrate-binding protein [Planctomycetes bacterium]|nr:molybdate ABC transporter substrate-binding protein [Planctomycetaceae bacterium]HIM31148.1 molybdate ABC transporter substrate-binding protein [Planctomycetota bacterium]